MIHQRHRQTDRQTDRQTTCDSKTALCTVVHRAVNKTKNAVDCITAGLTSGVQPKGEGEHGAWCPQTLTNFCHKCTRWSKKVRPLRMKAQIFSCPHLQNAGINFSDFWLTSTPSYSEYICWLHIHKIYHTRSGISKVWPCKDLSLQT